MADNSSISASLVKELREKTGAGMMECKKALEETKGNLDEAITYLRKKGVTDAVKKSHRTTSQGVIDSYIHGGGKIGVLVEVNCETDFVARTEEFKEMVKDLAMHICASAPVYISTDEISSELLNKEKEIYLDKARESKKPEHIIDKIVEGQLDKFAKNISLLSQPFVKNTDITVEEFIKEKIAKFGENIRVKRFVRFELGA
jgi:elongation factor Ts